MRSGIKVVLFFTTALVLLGFTQMSTVLAGPPNDTLYGMRGNSIFQISKTTASQNIFATNGIAMDSIAFDLNGILYGIEGNSLYTINLNTAVQTLIGSSGVAMDDVAFDGGQLSET